MPILVQSTPADPQIGGKARSLARLSALGLPVPPALVVTNELFVRLRAGGPPLPDGLSSPESLLELDHAADRLRRAELPAEVIGEVLEALLGWGAQRFSVRSSFAAEDRPDALAAGVYRSRTDLPASEVLRAIPDVLASALSPGAVTYARRHGLDAEAGPFAVLIHPYIAGLTGAAAWDPEHMAEPLIEPEEELELSARATIEAACRQLAAHMGSTEIEWVAAGERVTFLQARPYVAPALPRRWSQRLDELRAGGWLWDAAHNPLPLSPAQVGLVELVERRCQVPFHQRVEGGYLFFARAAAPTAAAGALQPELQRLAELEPELQAMGEEPPLESALALFVRAYAQIFGVVQPAAARARKELARFLETNLPSRAVPISELAAGVPSHATERLQLADAIAAAPADGRSAAIDSYLARFGDEAPVWDVAAPTFRETPAALTALVTRTPSRPAAPDPERAVRAITAALAPAAHAEWRRLVSALRAAVAAGEEDDWWYARVQAVVRRAMRALGRRMAAAGLLLAPDDVFWLPLDWSLRAARGESLPGDAQQTVRLARQQHLEELADPPPSSWTRGARNRMHELVSRDGNLVRGTPASPGRALGRVAHRTGAGERLPPEAVLVAPTLLPSELPLLQAAALVTETGGALDHVAAQARERGIPAVVGAEGACRVLHEGELVLVDADAGIVVRLGS